MDKSSDFNTRASGLQPNKENAHLTKNFFDRSSARSDSASTDRSISYDNKSEPTERKDSWLDDEQAEKESHYRLKMQNL